MRQRLSGIMMHVDVPHARLFDYAVVVSDNDKLHINKNGLLELIRLMTPISIGEAQVTGHKMQSNYGVSPTRVSYSLLEFCVRVNVQGYPGNSSA